MRLGYLRVKNFCGINEVRIEPLETGVTIIEGPNESGKSCLAKALYMVLDDLDTATRRAVLAARPVDRDVNPVIEAEIKSGPYEFTVEKMFHRTKGTTTLRLSKPSPANVTGRDAHNKVRSILDETIDMNLWRALNIIQGEDLIAIPTDSTLSMALEEAAGTAPISEQELGLFKAAETEAKKYFSSKGSPAGEHKAVIEKFEQLESTAGELGRSLQEAEREVESSTRFKVNLEALAPMKSKLENEKREREEALRAAAALRDQVMTEERIEASLKSNYDSVMNESRAREELTQAVTRSREELARLISIGDYASELAAAQIGLDSAKSQLESTESISKTASERRAFFQASLDHYEAKQWLEILSERRDRIDAARRLSSEARIVMERNRIDNEILEEIRKVAQASSVANSKLETNSPTVEVIAEKKLSAIINGDKIAINPNSPLEVKVVDSFTFKIPKSITFKVSPGIAPLKAKKKAAEALEDLSRLLNEYGVANITEAIRANHEWQLANANLERGLTTEKQDLRDLTYEQLLLKIEDCESRVRAFIAQEWPEFIAPSSPDEARQLLAETAEKAQEADQNTEKARDKYSDAFDNYNVASKKHQEATAAIEGVRGTLRSLEFQEELAENAASTDDLSKRVIEAKMALEAQTQSLITKKTELSKCDIETLEKLEQNAVKALSGYSDRVRFLERNLDLTLGKILYYEEQGTFEKADLAIAQLEQVKRERISIERTARAASLLLRVLEETKMESQKAYLQPLKDRIERLGRIVFGDTFEVELGEKLIMINRTQNGKTIPYEQLSTGTQEQLGLIMRLACAMIVSKEEGVPIIIDDALGHSDPMRIKDMAAVLAVAGNECQIILLTCLPERYAQIGGAKVIHLGSCTISA